MRLVILLVDCSVVQQWGGQGGQCPAGQRCSNGVDRMGNVQRVSGVTGRLLDKLQLLQNAAARLVTGARKFDRITPVMRELHWLPVRQRIRFKTAVLVFKCLHGLTPEYLSEYCKLTTGRSHLRSANACLLSVPRTRTTYGDRSFAVSGPVAWNSLPVALRSSDVSEETFRRHLKTFLFNCLDN